MVGVRGVLGPLKQRPLKLDGDLGNGVGRQLNQHLQEVGLHPVLGRLVVDVTWGPTGHPELFPGLSPPAPLVPTCPGLGAGTGEPRRRNLDHEVRQAPGGGRKRAGKGKGVSRAAVPGYAQPLPSSHHENWATRRPVSPVMQQGVQRTTWEDFLPKI